MARRVAGKAGQLNRREFVASATLTPLLSGCVSLGFRKFESELAALEKQSGGRLGAFILDTSNGESFGYRENERFGMCSTFKLALAGIMLRESEAGRIDFDQWLEFTPEDATLLWPDTRSKLVNGGMTIREMARTTQITSDNGCANALLRLIYGPAGFTAKVRELGDSITRLDRYEPTMNLVLPGDQRDTTSPRAMAEMMQRLLLGNALNDANKALLISWMEETKTGLKRIRAGLPSNWRVGDKTGTGIADPDKGMVNKYNDIAIAWPTGKAPLIITTYLDGPGHFENMRDEDQAILASIGKIGARWISR